MLYFWESWEYEYQGFQLKLSKYTDDYYTWEIESKNKNSDPQTLATALGLKSYSKKEYDKAINWENKHIHKLYSKVLVKKLLKLI